MDTQDLLAAYDSQLRGDAEVADHETVHRLGPLLLTQIRRGDGLTGFVTYRDLGGLDGEGLRGRIADAVSYFEHETDVPEVEWKTRGHDLPANLGELLQQAGFVPEEEESIMIGEAQALLGAPVPDGVSVRAITELDDIRRAAAMQEDVFGHPAGNPDHTAQLIAERPDDMSFWAAFVGGEIVSAGRVVRVPGTDFAGIWGGATLAEYRGRGIYRALTSARAQWAIERGVKFINSDSTEFSRPILERSGLVKVSTTTPYIWTR